MNDQKDYKKIIENNYKAFFIKISSITVSIIIVINLQFNLIIVVKLGKIDKIFF